MFVFSHHFCSAHSDEVFCCGLIETGLILQLKDVSQLGPDFICCVHFLLYQSCPWLIAQSQM